MIKVQFEEGVLELSNSYCYSTADDAIVAAAQNIGKKAIATKQWTVYDCVGPSWSHSKDDASHSCVARITGNFTEARKVELFEKGRWNDSAKIQFETMNCDGGNSSIEIIE